MIHTQEKYATVREAARLIAIGIYKPINTFPVHYTAVEPHSILYAARLEDELTRPTSGGPPKGIELAGFEGETRYPLLHDDQGDVLSFPR
jgi:hypothetical protein